MSAELLSRIQFAFTISFHIIFPAFSVGLATFLVVMEGLWLKTKNTDYYRICRFWTKVFALTFGMGIVSGIVMEFQLGTNWARYANSVGPILGALFTYEVMTAFFVEAGFLGIVIFGWNKVTPKLHYAATCCVFAGVTLSAFWILSANSWMQYPDGATLKNGIFVANNWWQIIFNPTVIPRFIHMMLSCYITTALIITGISAYYMRKNTFPKFSKKCFSFCLWVITIAAPIQIIIGDVVGADVHRYQPIKTAAMEGVWNTQHGAPFLIFAYPNQTLQKNQWSIGIPKAASFINTHKWNGTLTGLKSVAKKDQPPVAIVFYSFRIMVACGLLFLAMAILSLWLRYRKQLYNKRWFLHLALITAPLGFLAIETGWITAEVGRQPWIVQGFLRTINGSSEIPIYNVIVSFAIVVVVYGFIFGYFFFRYFFKTVRNGPLRITEVEKMPFGYMHPPTNEDDK